ncbi:transposase [Polluticaenibacter yanchengensis]
MTAVWRNMKSKTLSNDKRLLLHNNSVRETVNDELKNICHMEHTRA